ncbi:diguanylate cyclase domain-containing protein [Umezawaea tangerina]|uniref:PAS domain S-box-containing protein/diguanylate cyclase (GGDEF)-like protein n=1 Tax=Umezawaea tangerina TaxID=84725 RepID=A0A2T0THA3_9PSEU|nr:EAL domain-containing protein [Umezawaea tangerina]PRY45092.1 PAS domain S-box-containing protein/diguanylate cyclase (GGDEF)-like protein [Umezawaea tangerina]
MPEPEVAPDLLEFARRWAAALRGSGGAELETMVVRLAKEIGEQTVRGVDDRFTALYRDCPTAVVLTDPAGVVTAVNPAFLRLAGQADEGGVLGRHVSGVGAAEGDRAGLREALDELSAGSPVLDDIEIGGADDTTRRVRMSVTRLPDGAPVFMFEDMHELRLLQETFEYQSLHDSVTGLPNAAHFRSKLEAMTGTGTAEQIALLHLDIDGFKVVSDGLGTEAAELVLRGVAGALRTVFTDHGAFLARLYGDVFAVALRGELTSTTVVDLAERAIAELAKPVHVDDGIGVGVSASVGIVLADLPGPAHTDLMRSAEVALHRAKELGKAQWVLFDPAADQAARERYRLASAIAGAMAGGEMSVAYQPHVVLPDARIVTSLNAALRWDHPELGRLRSDVFYPLAETTGLTVPLGRYLLAEALRTTADWRARFGSDAPMVCLTLPQRMAIDGDLVGIVRAELDRNGLDPRHLMLCTDSPSLLDERGDLIESIGHLAGLGVLFILNVTGLTDLELVPALGVPAPAVMLVGAIVDVLDVDEPPEWARRNVRQLVERAEELGIKVGAYGVHSQEHAELLFALGVVVGSGPYVPEHVTREEAEVWIGRAYPMG